MRAVFNLRDLLFDRAPIIQAPMAAGVSTPELVAGVTNEQGIGSLGVAYDSPGSIAESMLKVKSLTSGPFNVNLFIFPPVKQPHHSVIQKAIDELNNFLEGGELSLDECIPPYFYSLEEQLEPIWDIRPDILTFHLGIPSKKIIEKAKSLKMLTGVTATCVNEARLIKEVGSDFIIAQGIEAGGHRGTFETSGETDDGLSTMKLSQILIKEQDLPIVSAGGIMTGRDILDFLSIGAIAVQMGTAFLCCPEAGTSDDHKRYLLDKVKRKTCLTKAFSGRKARSIEVEFVRLMDGKFVLPFPIQNKLTRLLRQKLSNPEYQSFWAGSNYRITEDLPVRDLMVKLKAELNALKKT
mgnify:FL=1